MKKVRIIGGMSKSRSISILSEEYTSTAEYDPFTDCILWEVKRNSAILRLITKKGSFFIPQTVKLILMLIDEIGIRTLVFGGLVLAGLYMLASILPGHHHASAPTSSGWWDSLVTYATINACIFTYIRQEVASWHGAEHKAIGTYDRLGSVRMKDIVKESRVNEKCGGRLFLPIIIVTTIAEYAFKSSGVNSIVVNLLSMEAILWIDKLIGWDKIPITSGMSRLLQKWITTTEPGEVELQTAQLALERLVAKHHSLA